MRLADRVSINLEAPNSDRLRRLAPTKVFIEELMQPMKWVAEIRNLSASSLGLEGAMAIYHHSIRGWCGWRK